MCKAVDQPGRLLRPRSRGDPKYLAIHELKHSIYLPLSSRHSPGNPAQRAPASGRCRSARHVLSPSPQRGTPSDRAATGGGRTVGPSASSLPPQPRNEGRGARSGAVGGRRGTGRGPRQPLEEGADRCKRP